MSIILRENWFNCKQYKKKYVIFFQYELLSNHFMSYVTRDLWHNHLPIIGFMEIKCLLQSNEHQFIRMQITHTKVFNTVH